MHKMECSTVKSNYAKTIDDVIVTIATNNSILENASDKTIELITEASLRI